MFYSSIDALKTLNDCKEVSILMNEDIKGMKLFTTSIPSSKRGDTIKTPLWLARHLESKGLAVIDERSENEWLGRIHWREKVKPPIGSLSLSSLPKDFYARVSNILQAFNYFSREDPVIRQRMLQIQNIFQDILNRRVRIISEMSIQNIDDPSFLERLTFEEKILLDLLKEILVGWRGKVGELQLADRER